MLVLSFYKEGLFFLFTSLGVMQVPMKLFLPDFSTEDRGLFLKIMWFILKSFTFKFGMLIKKPFFCSVAGIGGGF